jgi:drug/metabolite transporter (DMT)-like permease
MISAFQMLTGGLMLLAIGFVNGDAAHWQMSGPGLLSLVYLVLFNSCIAYTAYTWLSRHTTPAVTGTYSYVNPAIAALLGWLVLDEHLSGIQLIGMAIILLGVLLVNMPSRDA